MSNKLFEYLKSTNFKLDVILWSKSDYHHNAPKWCIEELNEIYEKAVKKRIVGLEDVLKITKNGVEIFFKRVYGENKTFGYLYTE